MTKAALKGGEEVSTPCPHMDDHPEFRTNIEHLQAAVQVHTAEIKSLNEFMANLKGFLLGLSALAAGIGAVAGIIARGLGK